MAAPSFYADGLESGIVKKERKGDAMSGTLENFNDHYVAALKDAPRRLAGWLDRVLDLEDQVGEAQVIDLDDRRGPKRPLMQVPQCMSGYPPVRKGAEAKQAMVESALGAHGGFRAPSVVAVASWRNGRRTSARYDAVVLKFPFKPLAILRDPKKRIAHVSTKDALRSSGAQLPEVTWQ